MFRRLLVCSVVLAVAGCGGTEAVDTHGGRFALAELLGGTSGDYARALIPRDFEFPRDHGPHPSFRSEWWYLTANLASREGQRYGVQFTIFRQSIGDPIKGGSRWRVRSAWMVHAALTDVGARSHRSRETVARGGALGLAGDALDASGVRVWVEDQRLAIGPRRMDSPRRSAQLPKSWVSSSLWAQRSWASHSIDFRSLRSKVWVSCSSPGADFSIELDARSDNEPVPNGTHGLSQKGPEAGNASYYYSIPHLDATGMLTIDGHSIEVTGHAWLDREWGTSVLSSEYAGWDWFALHLSTGRALMVYRLRRRDGGPSRFTYGAWYPQVGGSTPVGVRGITPKRWWSAEDGVRWPIAWLLELDNGAMLNVSAAVDDQLMRRSIRYWEGAVSVSGSDGKGATVVGDGYMEMTGYGIED